MIVVYFVFFFFQAEDGIRDIGVTGVQTCALPIWLDPALLSAQKLSVGLVDEETGVRGYAISGVPAFLEPYLTGHQQEIEATGELRSLGRPAAAEELESDLEGVLAAAQ